jgi:tRNA modification GTPase
MDNNNKSIDDTIVALATPRGKGAIAIVRLSGKEAIMVASRLVKQSDMLLCQESHRLSLVDVVGEKGEVLDHALCAVYRKPHSYTGENVVEFFLHGSPYVIARTIDACCSRGARNARPGEFTLRAYMNGKMDLAQAEAVADLVASAGRVAHKTAILQREGTLSSRIQEIRNKVIEICGLVELDIDFTDQDLPVVDKDKVLRSIDDVLENLHDLESSFTRGRLAREGASVVIAGAPNVGKSTLFNRLLGEDRAIVHETPGTTRDTVEAAVEWSGLTIKLSDTAGQADQFAGPDEEAALRARHTSKTADLVLWMIDLTDPYAENPPDELKDRIIILGNKSDLVESENASIRNYNIKISALHGVGIEEIRESVVDMFATETDDKLQEGILTRERHYGAVRKAVELLGETKISQKKVWRQDLLAFDLREVADILGEIVGEIKPDDVLNKIFADFCIGK